MLATVKSPPYNTNSAFGTITTAALPARHGVVSVRFTF
jgi:hypothetical protein